MSADRPFIVAHRSGNSLAALRTAEALGVTAIEADVYLFRGRLELRHLKTLGPIPILWDRWKLASPFSPRLLLGELLAALAPQTGLVLDLKGRDRRLSERLIDAIQPRLDAGLAVTVCARSWPLLEPFSGLEGVCLVHSVGTARQLERLRRSFRGAQLGGIAIHEELLDSRTARELREVADVILTWPINTLERARELVAWGVDGLITDRPDIIRSLSCDGGRRGSHSP